MNSTCSACGTALPDGVREKQCPACLLRAGMEAETVPSGMDEYSDGIGARAGAQRRQPQATCTSLDPTALAPRETLGTMIGRYQLLREIGEGGFGIVYLAEQKEPVKRKVALKVLKPGMDTREVVVRFEAERQALALMDHPNIAKVFDGGATDSGRPYFVMELVKGFPLTKYCDDHQLTTRQRLDLFLDVLSAVQHAHQKGIIHRDLKPSNIMVSPHDGVPVIKVIDFGIAKAVSMELTSRTVFTGVGTMIGTPQYMSPEQAEVNALDVDTRSDLYSLGVVLYELLTGRTPLDAKKLRAAGYAEIQRLIREETPAKPSTRISALGEAVADIAKHRSAEPSRLTKQIRGDLDWIVMKALEKDRTRRYETANGFAADIRRHLKDQPVLARAPGMAYLLSRFIRRHKFGFAAGTAIAAALLGGIAATTWALIKEKAARNTAESETEKTKAANRANKENLHRASMADFARGVQALNEDLELANNSKLSWGSSGKSKWHEGVALLTRALELDGGNADAAGKLYETLWSRGLWKMERSRKYGTRKAYNVVASPDERRVFTMCEDESRPANTIGQVWDFVSGQAVGRPLNFDGRVWMARFSDDGSELTTFAGDWSGSTMLSEEGGGELQIFDAKSGRAASVGIKTNYKDALAYTRDFRRLLLRNAEGALSLVDSKTGVTVRLDASKLPPVNTGSDSSRAAFSPDGTRLVTIHDEQTLHLWDGLSGQHTGTIPDAGAELANAIISPDNRILVTAGVAGHVGFWDAITGEALPIRLMEAHEAEYSELIRFIVGVVAFNPDGTKVMFGMFNNLMDPRCVGMVVLDVMRRQRESFPGIDSKMVFSFDFTPEGSRFLTRIGGGGLLREGTDLEGCTVATEAGSLMQTIGEPRFRYCADQEVEFPIVFEPSGLRASAVNGETDSRLVTWEISPTLPTLPPPRLEPAGSPVGISADGSNFIWVKAEVGGGRSLTVTDVETGERVGKTLFLKGGRHGPYSADAMHVVTQPDWSTVTVWSFATGSPSGRTVQVPECTAFPEVKLSPNCQMLVTVGGGMIRLWDVMSGTQLGEPVSVENQIHQVDFCLGGTRLFVHFDNGQKFWDVSRTTGLSLNESVTGVKILQNDAIQTGKLPPRNDVHSVRTITPDILVWTRTVSGLRFNDDGEFQAITDEELAAGAERALPPGPWADLAAWLNTPAPWRPIHPGAKMTLRELAEQERDYQGDGTVESLESAVRYDPSVPLGHLLLGAALEREDAGKPEDQRDAGVPQRAAFLRRFSLDGLQRETGRVPDDKLATLWLRAARHLAGLAPEKKVGIGAKEAPARDEAVKAARRVLELVPGMKEAEELLRSLTP